MLLGGAPLGKLPLGQITTGITTVLSVTNASYTLTLQSVTFGYGINVTPATYIVTGGTVLAPVVVDPASYIVTGRTVTFALTSNIVLSVDPAHYVVSGQFVGPTFEEGTVLTRGGGPAFTRRRYKELLAEIEAERLAEQLKQDELARAAAETVRAAIEKARAEVLAARAAEQAQWAGQQRLRDHAAALANDQAMARLQTAMHAANITMANAAHQAHARHAQDDDEEALALLLMSHGDE